MPAEFDFNRSIPNPWFVAVHGPEYVRVIDKDLAALFSDNESMNSALRSTNSQTEENPEMNGAIVDDDDPLNYDLS